jgi:hypothetical protein
VKITELKKVRGRFVRLLSEAGFRGWFQCSVNAGSWTLFLNGLSNRALVPFWQKNTGTKWLAHVTNVQILEIL